MSGFDYPEIKLESHITPVHSDVGDTKISTESQIITFSDIHADIHLLVILLRDLAGVIRKKPAFTFDGNTADADMERLLKIDIEGADGDYIEDLNYEWIYENNSYIVIVGDMIDGTRCPDLDHHVLKSDGTLEHEYPQVEIKILRFINALNKQALMNRGRIYKLLGNHEVMNMLGEGRDYWFKKDKIFMKPYYRGLTREQVFKCNQIGHQLLMEDSCKCILMINNYIFVHGQLLDDMEHIHEYNNYNNILTYPVDVVDSKKKDEYEDVLKKFNTDKMWPPPSILWKREYGSDEEADRRFKDPRVQSEFCTKVNENIKRFLGIRDAHNIKIVIGHCTQNYATRYDMINKSFATIVPSETNNVKITLQGPSKIGKFSYTDNLVFGITMECPINEFGTGNKIFKVDTGSSRAFDQIGEINGLLGSSTRIGSSTSREIEQKQFFSRTPSLLQIISDNDQHIIKSTMKNTRIHQPRYSYEKKIKDNPLILKEIDMRETTNNDYYKKKYLKYKQKYIDLKK
jgi:hypothetical protein